MKIYLTILALSICFAASGQEEASRRRNFNLELGVAMRGFDPVSYFNGKPMKGNSKIYFEYKAVTYHFVNEANMEAFKKSPGKFEPAYGGWCAYTVALNGERVKLIHQFIKLQTANFFCFIISMAITDCLSGTKMKRN